MWEKTQWLQVKVASSSQTAPLSVELDDFPAHVVPFTPTHAIEFDNLEDELGVYAYDSVNGWQLDSSLAPTDGIRLGTSWEFSVTLPSLSSGRLYVHALVVSGSGREASSPSSSSHWGFLVEDSVIPNFPGLIGTWPTKSVGSDSWNNANSWKDGTVPNELTFAYIDHSLEVTSLDTPIHSFFVRLGTLSGSQNSGNLQVSSGGHLATEVIACCSSLPVTLLGSASIGQIGSAFQLDSLTTPTSGIVSLSQTSLATLTVRGATVQGTVTYVASELIYEDVTSYPVGPEWSNPSVVTLIGSSVRLSEERSVGALNLDDSSSFSLEGTSGDSLTVSTITNEGIIDLSEEGIELIAALYIRRGNGLVRRNGSFFGCPSISYETDCSSASLVATVSDAVFIPIQYLWEPGDFTSLTLSPVSPGSYLLTFTETGVEGNCPPEPPQEITVACVTTGEISTGEDTTPATTGEATTGQMTTGQVTTGAANTEPPAIEESPSTGGSLGLALGLGLGLPLGLLLIGAIIAVAFFVLKNRKHESLVEEGGSPAAMELNDIPKAEPPVHTFSSVQQVGISVDQNIACRRTMEDEHIAIDEFGGNPSQGYFAVYDGHGGRDVVEFIAKQFHRNILIELKKCMEIDPHQSTHTTILSALTKAHEITDAQIIENKINKSGSTSVLCFLRKNSQGEKWLYSANIGDARAVLCRGGKALRLTVDHKASDETEAKRIKDDGGWVVQNKVAGILAVTRAFGNIELKQWVIPTPHVAEVQLNADDTFLIVACDGLWDVCSDQEAVDILMSHSEESAQSLSDRLLSHALKNKTKDNISLMVIRL